MVGVGAQNELVNGNPSMTHFRSVYRRHTNFAMEHIRMAFTSSNLEFSATGTKTIQCRVDRYAQMLHDTYLVITLPDIWSPMVTVSSLPTGYGIGANQSPPYCMGYEFQWIKNLGYNLIDHVSITLNGQVIQSLTGEWMKMYSYATHDRNKRLIVDQMVGNVPEVYDPANAFDRRGQYPHAVSVPLAKASTVSPGTNVPEPSIRSRQLVIPLHFWFCENPGLALPLVSLQNSEVYINVTLRNINDLYTVIDTNPASPTFGKRVKPTTATAPRGLPNLLTCFLSPPNTDGSPSNPILSTFFPDPWVEGNFLYLTEMEMNQLARADQTFLVKTVNHIKLEGQFGPNTDVQLPMFNLATRVVFYAQRLDKIQNNDWDNYTNWDDPNRPPWTPMIPNDIQSSLYSSGMQQVSSVYPRDSVVDGLILLDGKERFSTKTLPFFSLLQMYRHSTGDVPKDLPGVYMYSFALENDQYQPSGAINGSMFNKILLRLSLQQPLPQSVAASSTQVVYALRSTVFSPNPTIITAAQCAQLKPDGTPLYPQTDIVPIVQTNDNIIFVYTYTVGAYVESINFLRIVSGLANLVFAS